MGGGEGNEWELEEVVKGRKAGEGRKKREGGGIPWFLLIPLPRYEILDKKNC